MTVASDRVAIAGAGIREHIAARRDALAELAIELGRVPSPHGQERAVAERVAAWLGKAGIEAWLQPITATSANVIGRIRGDGTGRSVMLNAHLDTGPPLAPGAGAQIHGAWAQDGMIFGAGVVNDKGQLAALLIATEAINASGLALRGDLLITGVAFETGAPSTGPHQGIENPGEGFGAWWLVNRGVVADFALVAETSGFGVIDVECGALTLEVSLAGRAIYTPRLVRGTEPREHPSAIARAATAIGEIEAWAIEYEARHTRAYGAGQIVPRAQVVALDGRPSGVAMLVDVRLLPGARPHAVVADLRSRLRAAGIEGEIECRQWSRGYIARGAGPLVGAITRAHRAVHGSTPPEPPAAERSMWRDMNMFNELGIPAVCYGPPRQLEPYSDARDRAVRIEDLVAAAQVYAEAALAICAGEGSGS